MKAIILAGGEGTRLRPITYEIPKALILVQGKTLTEQVFDIFKKIGVTEIYLSISYLADKMVDYFGDGSNFGLKISYLREDKPMGTAGPLMIFKKNRTEFTDDFFMCNGDNLFALDLREMIKFHQTHKAVATIALSQVSDTTQFGVAKLEGDRIIDFIEKPPLAMAPSNYINSGYYILSPKIFDYVDLKDFSMVEKDIWPVLAKEGKLFGFRSAAQWFDTGTPERWQAVQNEWRGIK